MTRQIIKTPIPKMEGNVVCTVAEAAERTGLSVHTLRYYERCGLLTPVPRDRDSNHRRYTADDLAALTFIQRMRGTGMPIRELQRYMTLRRQGDATAEARRLMLEERRCAVLAQIEELKETLTIIDYKIATCIYTEAGQSDADATRKEK